MNLGPVWRMPSKEQFEELINSSYTTTEWTTLNGINGRKITSRTNGNSIFLPAVGFREYSSLNDAGSVGYYWSRSLYSNSPYVVWHMYVNSSGAYMNNDYRWKGRSVRPVRLSE
jgi:uncharacterized protein (TIGR02145 family)